MHVCACLSDVCVGVWGNRLQLHALDCELWRRKWGGGGGGNYTSSLVLK